MVILCLLLFSIRLLNVDIKVHDKRGGCDHTNGVDDEGESSWPPLRQAGVFDPFMDDSRVAVQFVYLCDNTVVVGGAAGQVIVYQFLNLMPCIEPVTVPIKKSMPGFQWKGHAPLTVNIYN
ncbi:unnamed protein product [Trichobilharzia regenti]|nr:unnamed protein product [Trichobilharzia regenti]